MINDDLENCYNKISNLINAKLNNNKGDYDQKFIEKHIKPLIN